MNIMNSAPASQSKSKPIEIPLAHIYRVYNAQHNVLMVFSAGQPIDIDRVQPINEKTQIIFSERMIYKDDTVEEIQVKVLTDIQQVVPHATLSTMYTFVTVHYKTDWRTLYESITGSIDAPLDKAMFLQIAVNMGIDATNAEEKHVVLNKEEYGWEDFKHLNTGQRYIPLGFAIKMQKTNQNTPLLFPAHPLQIQYYHSDMETISHQQDTLLSHGLLRDNTFHLCFMHDVIDHAHHIENTWLQGTYFPRWKRSVDKHHLDRVLHNNDVYVRPYYDLFYITHTGNSAGHDITFESKQTGNNLNKALENEYESRGITSVTFTLINPSKVILPLEVIFNKVHAVQNVPFIKLNDLEPKLRLYSQTKSLTSGTLIPVMSHSRITTLSREHIRDLVFALTVNDKLWPIVIRRNGEIEVTFQNEPTSEQDFDRLMVKHLNAFITEMNQFLETSGFKFPHYTALKDENVVQIKKINMRIVASYPLKRDSFKLGPLTGIFSVIEEKVSVAHQARLIFRRVSNYNTVQEVREKIRLLRDKPEAVRIKGKQDLVRSYGMPASDIETMAEEIWNPENKYMVKKRNDEPGIMCDLHKEHISGLLTFDLEGIPSAQYMHLMYMYVDSFLQYLKLKEAGRPIPVWEKMTGTKPLVHRETVVYASDANVFEEEEEEEEELEEEEQELEEQGLEEEEDKGTNELESDIIVPEEEVDELEVIGIPQAPAALTVPTAPDANEPIEEQVANIVEPIPVKEEEPVDEDAIIETEQVSQIQAQLDAEKNGSVEEGEQEIQDELEAPAEEEVKEVEEVKEEVPVPVPTEEKEVEEEKEEVKEEVPVPTEEEQMADSVIQEEPAIKNVDPNTEVTNDAEIEAEKAEQEKQEAEKVEQQKQEEEEKEEQMKDQVAEEPLPSDQEAVITDEQKKAAEEEEARKKKAAEEEEARKKKAASDDSPELLEGGAKQEGGAKKSPVTNYSFLSRLQKRDPAVFKTDSEENEQYARICQKPRQPVVLTDTELEKIQKQDGQTGQPSYKESIAYRGNNYICPRFWHFNENRSISNEEIKKNGLLPFVMDKGKDVASNLKVGKYIYEIKPDAKNMYPGFEKQKNKNGLCYPCCFGSKLNDESKMKDCLAAPSNKTKEKGQDQDKDLEGQEKEGQDLEDQDKDLEEKGDDQEEDQEEEQGPQPKKKIKKHYVEQKFPLPQNRWGIIPSMISEAMGAPEFREKQVIMNTPTLLRQGMEKIENQSFLACFADIYTYVQDEAKSKLGAPVQRTPVPSVQDFKEVLLDTITLDKFVKYQNSSLASIFKPATSALVDTAKYTTSIFYQSLDAEDPDEQHFFEETVAAYEMYRNYLKEPSIVIDHHFLWDALSTPDVQLIPNGLNLVIFEWNEDNVQLVCPPNIYSNHSLFDPVKPSFFLIKKKVGAEMVYEPIYNFIRKRENKYSVEKLFTKDKGMPFLTEFIKRLHTVYKGCSGTPENASEKVLPLYELTRLLQTKDVRIQSQVTMNNTCIGVVVVKFPEMPVPAFIPCLHSTLLADIPVIKNRDEVVTSYATTKSNLRTLKRLFPSLHCTPSIKVVDRVKSAIVGILLENGLYVPVIEEAFANVVDGLKTVYNIDYWEADKAIFSDRVDDERILARVHTLEDNFYRIFQFQVRVHINEQHNFKYRAQLIQIVNAEPSFESQTLAQKREQIQALLKDHIMKDAILFQDMNPDLYKHVDKIASCHSGNPHQTYYCMKMANGHNKVFFPKQNLVNPSQDNSVSYFVRLADELLRNAFIRNMVLQPSYLFVDSSEIRIETDVRENEIVVFERDLHTLLSSDTAFPTQSRFYNHNDFAMAQPQLQTV